MKLSQYMLFITHFMALLGLYAVTMVQDVSLFFIVAMGAAIGLNFYLMSRRKRLIPRGLWNIAAIVIFIIFIADFFWGGQNLTSSAARFLTLLLVAKLYDLRNNRDYVIAYCTVFFQILAAAASTVSMLFLPVLLLFIIGSIFAMITVNIQREFELGKNRGIEPPRGIFDVPFTTYAAVLSTVTISLTFLLFMVLPRMEAGFLQKKDLVAVKEVGFSDKVDLDILGPVKKDPTVIMRVDFPQMKRRPHGPLYFRGTTLSLYDGKAMLKGPSRERLVRKRGGRFELPSAPRGMVMKARVLLEPLNTNVLFTLPRAVRIEGNFKNLWEDEAGTVYLPSPPFSRMEYKVWSSPAAVRPAPGADMSRFTDLSRMDSRLRRRIRALALKITEGAALNVERSARIRNYLRSNYTYTLDPKRKRGTAPVEDFLFYSKEGFCEHFATAFVLLARSIGIPARIVTGFLEGEWNSAGRYFIVRQSDAHSWAEIYAGPAAGWVRADPTPPAGFTPLVRGTGLANYLDYMHLKWNRYVVNFTNSDQRRLAQSFREKGLEIAADVKGFLAGAGSYAERSRPVLLSLLLVLVLALFAVRSRERRSRLALTRTPAFYVEMLRVLRKRGVEKKASETAMEFARRVSSPGVREITEIYQRVRFGSRRCDPSEETKIREIIRSLKKKGRESR